MLLLHHFENPDFKFSHGEHPNTDILFPHCLLTSQLRAKRWDSVTGSPLSCAIFMLETRREGLRKSLVQDKHLWTRSNACGLAEPLAQPPVQRKHNGNATIPDTNLEKNVLFTNTFGCSSPLPDLQLYCTSYSILYKVDGEDKRIQSLESTKLALDGNLKVLTSCHSKNKNGSFIFGTET